MCHVNTFPRPHVEFRRLFKHFGNEFHTIQLPLSLTATAKNTTIKLQSARCCKSTSLTMQKAASEMSRQFPVTPTEFCLPHQNQLHNCEFPLVSFRSDSGQIHSLLPHIRQTSHRSHTMKCFSPPMIFTSCTIFGTSSGCVIESAGFTFVPTLSVKNLFNLEACCIHKFCMST